MRECFHHGGRVGTAQAAFPDAPLPWIDLSTGLNPSPYPTAGIDFDWVSLPDEEKLIDLEHAAAAAFGLQSVRPCAVPGTEIGLRLLATLDLPHPVRIASPSYGSYLDAWPSAVTTHADELDRVAREPGTVVLANPNNPDGRMLTATDMIELARRIATAGGVLVIDEAFADATPEASLLPHLHAIDPRHLIVLRSFGKFFGLGGVRLGFVVCDDARAKQLRHRLGSWPLSTAAIMIGEAAYRNHDWASAARRRLACDARRLDDLLARHGLSASGACPLFRLVMAPGAQSLFGALAREGILTRPFEYAPTWLRLGLPGSEMGWSRLDAVLEQARG